MKHLTQKIEDHSNERSISVASPPSPPSPSTPLHTPPLTCRRPPPPTRRRRRTSWRPPAPQASPSCPAPPGGPPHPPSPPSRRGGGGRAPRDKNGPQDTTHRGNKRRGQCHPTPRLVARPPSPPSPDSPPLPSPLLAGGGPVAPSSCRCGRPSERTRRWRTPASPPGVCGRTLATGPRAPGPRGGKIRPFPPPPSSEGTRQEGGGGG